MIMVMMDWSEICWSLSVLLEGVDDEISLFGLLTLDMQWNLLGSSGSREGAGLHLLSVDPLTLLSG
jgi:hypothetical protein